MKFDAFFSICQTPVNGSFPNERAMFLNFFDQVRLADELGFGTAWVAETHLSCQVQKKNPGAVIPHFKGEIGLNTDILQLAHKVFAMTRRIHVGSAIRNILCNGGPIAHAENLRTFMSLHSLDPRESRNLHLGFASGRFPFSNFPFGIQPRNEMERAVWPVLKGRIFQEATELFLRLLKGESIGSKDIKSRGKIGPEDFRSPQEDWKAVEKALGKSVSEVEIPSFYSFEPVGVIPFEAPLGLLTLTLGSADPVVQELANTIMPVRVFNLSITPPKKLEETHSRMQKIFHPQGGPWKREYLPRTVLCFICNDQSISLQARRERAQTQARLASENYWTAIEGTLDPLKVEQATENALVGTPEDILEQCQSRFHPEDRLMLWFDFNNHDNEAVKRSMIQFMEHVAAHIS